MSSSRASKTVFFLLAVPAVLRASARVTRLRQERVDRQVETLRRTSPFRSARLRHPGHLAASVDRLIAVLPPFGYGRCYKRSLLLVDLWSRCGLEPMLHLGVRSEGAPPREPLQQRHFHAWVTTHEGGPWTASRGHAEIWSG